jgi:pimeloyl-ACP methyl ester carboxylesterase
MLQPIRTEGGKPPFFIVHGLHGIMPLAHVMGPALDRDQPLYALHARGFDGTEPPHDRMEDLLAAYLAEIRAARPRGPYAIGGLCAGGFIAMELASALRSQGERVGSVILMDPPMVPYHRIESNRVMNPKADRGVHQQLYAGVEKVLRDFVEQSFYLPFNVNDPVQMRRAIEIGIGLVVMFGRYVPPRFDGPTDLIICADHGFGHFHPEGPWSGILTKRGRVYAVPGSHREFFDNHLSEVLRLMQFALGLSFDG